MTREDVLREFGKREETKESATGLRIHVSSPAHAAAMADEIVRLRERETMVRTTLAFTQRADFEASRDWDRLSRAADYVLAALGGDDA